MSLADLFHPNKEKKIMTAKQNSEPKAPAPPTLLDLQNKELARIEAQIVDRQKQAKREVASHEAEIVRINNLCSLEVEELTRQSLVCREGISLLQYAPGAERIMMQLLEREIARRDKEAIGNMVGRDYMRDADRAEGHS